MLGPILFLAYINDLPQDNVPQVRLFADNTAIYLTLEHKHDSDTLQTDLDRLQAWEAKWDMEFNPSKCQVIRVATSRTPLQTQYILQEQVLEVVDCARYFGVDILAHPLQTRGCARSRAEHEKKLYTLGLDRTTSHILNYM